MSSIHTFRLVTVVLAVFMLPVICAAAKKEAPARPKNSKLSLTAALVLTPEFCATKIKKGKLLMNQEEFPVGEYTCDQLEPALKPVFTSLRRVNDPAQAGTEQVILTPKFADVAATQGKTAFSKREVKVLVEWTVRDQAGKTLWLDTVEGSATGKMGNAFTGNKHKREIMDDVVEDMVEQSAMKISAAPELVKLNQAAVK